MAQQARTKQLKRVQLLKAQTYQKAHQLTYYQEKETLEEARGQAAQIHLGELRAVRNKHEASVEVRSTLSSWQVSDNEGLMPNLCTLCL